MIDLDIALANIIALADGEIVGRVRLQKMIFILQQLNHIQGIPYRYHHYGPYSRKVDEALEKAKALGLVKEEFRRRSGDGAEYSVFTSTQVASASNVTSSDPSGLKAHVAEMKRKSSTVLELAATIYWLKHVEIVDQWSDELQVRKGSKTGNGRKEQALDMLSFFGIP